MGARSNSKKQNKADAVFKNNLKKNKKKLFIIGGISVLLLILLLLFINSLFHNPFKESFDLLFFDTDELCAYLDTLTEDGVGASLDLTLPLKSLSVSARGVAWHTGEHRGDDATGAFEIKLGGIGSPLEISYDKNSISVTYGAEPRETLTVTRNNTAQGLRNSIFHPDSKSEYALSEKNYATLSKVLAALETKETDTERVSLKKTLLKIAKKVVRDVDIGRSYSIEDFGINTTTTVNVDTDGISKIIDVILKEMDEVPALEREIISPELLAFFKIEYESDVTDTREILELIKEKAHQRSAGIFLSFTERDGKISLARLDVRYIEDGEECRLSFDARFEYTKSSASFELLAERERSGGKSRIGLKYSKETDREQNTVKITADLSRGEKSYSFSLDYDGNSKDYNTELLLGEDVYKINGGVSVDKKSGELDFSVSEAKIKNISIKSESIFSLSLYPTKEMPAVSLGTSLFEISEADFRRFYKLIERVL